MENNKRQISDKDERIGKLIAALVEDNLDPATARKLREWLNDPSDEKLKQEAFLRYLEKQLKPHMGKADAETRRRYAELAAKLGFEQKAPAKPKTSLLLRRVALRVAAVVLPAAVVLGAGYLAGWFGAGDGRPAAPGAQVAGLIIEAVEGIQKDAYLPDSSRVWVDEGSRLTYPETFAGERHVQLEGHAYFAVKADKAHPFIVHTRNLDVRVLGTEFDVKENRESNTTVIALFKGSVEVTAGAKSERLVPGQVLSYNNLTEEMTVAAMETQTGGDEWRTDAIFTHGKTAAQLLSMIGNYYDMEIVFDSAAFSGTEEYDFGFKKTERVEEVLTALSRLNGNFSFEMDGPNRKIYIKR